MSLWFVATVPYLALPRLDFPNLTHLGPHPLFTTPATSASYRCDVARRTPDSPRPPLPLLFIFLTFSKFYFRSRPISPHFSFQLVRALNSSHTKSHLTHFGPGYVVYIA